MSFSQQIHDALKSQPLKKVLPKVAQRKKYFEYALSKAKVQKPIVVRVQPHERFKFLNTYATLTLNEDMKLIQILRFFMNKNIISEKQTYLFFTKKIFAPLNKSALEVKDKSEEDGILYLQMVIHQFVG